MKAKIKIILIKFLKNSAHETPRPLITFVCVCEMKIKLKLLNAKA